MSVTLAKIDQDALNAFKASFGYEEDPIRGAFEDVERLTQSVAANKKEQEFVTARRKMAQGDYDRLYGKRKEVFDKNGKWPKASDKETEAETTVGTCDTKLASLQNDLPGLERDLEKAQLRKELDPWQEYMKQLKHLNQRLADAGQQDSAIADAIWDGPIKPFDEKRFKDFEIAVKAQQKAVDDLCVPVERKKQLEEIAGWLEALEKYPYHDDKRINELREAARDADLPTLKTEIEPALAEAEAIALGFSRRIDEAHALIGTIHNDAMLPAYKTDPAGKKLDTLEKRALKALDEERLAELDALEADLVEMQDRWVTAREAHDTYRREAGEAEKLFADFLGRSKSHKSYQMGLDNKVRPFLSEAESFAAERNFVTAADQVRQAQALLDEWDVRAWAVENKQDAEAAAKQKLLDQQKKAAQAAKDKEDKENRDDIEALNLIGRQHFEQWLMKAGKLMALQVIGAATDDPVGLNKQTETVEIVVSLYKQKATDPEIDNASFVVHYHPWKMKPNGTTKQDKLQAKLNESSLHAKPTKHLKHTRDGLYDWVQALVPTLAAIKKLALAKSIKLVK